MKLFRRKDKPLPPEAMQARDEADNAHAEALTFLGLAESLTDSLRRIREQNHIAEALQVAHRSNK